MCRSPRATSPWRNLDDEQSRRCARTAKESACAASSWMARHGGLRVSDGLLQVAPR
jgi:hypothetical protein